MIGKKMLERLNAQINEEIASSYLYLSMSGWFHTVNLPGFAAWMRVQAQEELLHAAKLFDYIVQRGGAPRLKALEAPAAKWASPLAAFEAAYKHEQHITACIHGLVEAAAAEKDHATGEMLRWFVTEQVEEEASADEVVQKLRMVKESAGGLLYLDKDLGKRTFGK